MPICTPLNKLRSSTESKKGEQQTQATVQHPTGVAQLRLGLGQVPLFLDPSRKKQTEKNRFILILIAVPKRAKLSKTDQLQLLTSGVGAPCRMAL